MKTILSLRRHHYLAIVSIFLIILIMVALIVGMAGCGGGPYDLTISSNEGGTVTTPGEGTFTYDARTVVDLVAEAEEGYRFASWITYGYVETIADWSDATTTITMNDDYNISAGFALEIQDWYDLDDIRNNLSGSYILVNDLDSTTPGYEELASPTANEGKGWQPIGTRGDRFTGTFYGEGYEIRDLFINRLDEERVGLFGFLSAALIVDVGVVNAKVTGKDSVGGLVGSNSGTMHNSYSTGSVTGDSSVGGLVGLNNGHVQKSYSTGNVTGEGSIGGLVGLNVGTVTNSYSTGSVTSNHSVGGLVGMNWDGTVSDSYSTGSVTGTSSVGGLVGWNLGGTVSNSFWDTQTSGKSTSDGGTGKTTAELKDIITFSGDGWNIIAVAPGERNPTYIWNIVNGETYPFLSWQSVS